MSYTKLLLALAFAATGLCSRAAEPVGLQEVASFPNQQVTGVTVSKKGRVFVNFPFWADEHGVSVAEIKDGKPVPYPDAEWNKNEGDPGKRFVCVQSVIADDADNLWVLDPASPKMEGIVKGGPKLVKIDLTTNRVVEIIHFNEGAAPQHSYLNDVRVDTKKQQAFITESGLGALLVLDLSTKETRRLLTKHPATQPETGTDLVVDGIRLVDPKTQTTPTMNADGIALDLQAGMLYLRPLTGRTVYQVKESDLLDTGLSDEDLGKRVTKVGVTPATDGMIESPSGRIYCAAFENDSITRLDPKTGKAETVIQDKRLQWPDTLSWGPDGALYVTCSQIHRMAKYNRGESKQAGPFKVFKVVGIGE